LFYLEDNTMKVKLDLSCTESDGESYFIEGNIVFCQGDYNGAKFRVTFMSHIPLYQEKP